MTHFKSKDEMFKAMRENALLASFLAAGEVKGADAKHPNCVFVSGKAHNGQVDALLKALEPITVACRRTTGDSVCASFDASETTVNGTRKMFRAGALKPPQENIAERARRRA